VIQNPNATCLPDFHFKKQRYPTLQTFSDCLRGMGKKFIILVIIIESGFISRLKSRTTLRYVGELLSVE
jgi:hypothetical protein